MKIHVLGCSAAEMPNSSLTSFLVDEKILLDAGTIGSALSESRQRKIKYALITHAHLDHIKDLPFFADTLSSNNKVQHVTLISTREISSAIKQNLFNNVVWPDFTSIPSRINPVIKIKNIKTGKAFRIDGYKIIAYKVSHSVPAVGYLVEDACNKKLLYTGDTGPTERMWISIFKKKIHVLIIEISFPDKMKSVALKTGHLTPKLLESELKKLKHLPENIYITHCKPKYRKRIREDLKKLNIKNIKILNEGKTCKF